MPQAYGNMIEFENIPDSMDYFLSVANGMSNMDILSPGSSSNDSQNTGDSPSPLSASELSDPSTFITLNNATGTVLGTPYLSLIDPPVEKFRFRYKSEMMGTHGSLTCANASSRRKQAPMVELFNYPLSATIRCSLVTADSDRRVPHVHRLVCRIGNDDRSDPHEILVGPESGYQASFQGMGIIHTAKKNVMDEYIKKKRQIILEEARRKNPNKTTLSVREEAALKMEATDAHKSMNLNSVALCFQAFSPNQHGVMIPLTDPIYSQPINNLKSALTGELKICRIDKITSSCEGGEEIFMLVEKVGKKNIKIRFFELNDDDREIWSAYGQFTELDVHHQYAIVFRTPPYNRMDITSSVEVFVQLYRPTDGDCSEPMRFLYKPSDAIRGHKRPRLSYENSGDLMPMSVPVLSPLNEVTSTNMIIDDISYPSNLSAELEKHLEYQNIDSEEFKQFFKQADLSDYIKVCPQTELGEKILHYDGPSVKQDGVSFAKDIMSEIVKIIKKNPQELDKQCVPLLKERTVYGDSPLHSALRHGQRKLSKDILTLLAYCKDHKSIVNAQNSSGKTCLHYAVMQNQPEVTRALLHLGADPNACDDHGFSPLHTAVKHPDAGLCVDALLKGGDINIETRDDAGWTAFHLAAEAGALHAVKSLVKANVDVNSTDMSYGRTALHIAVEGGHKDIVEFLLKATKIDVNKRNFSGNTALHSAVVNTGARAKELCELLLNSGANPSISNDTRESTSKTTKDLRTTVIKAEVESNDEEDDDDGEEQSNGQTSFDLASEKPEILELLKTRNNEETEEMPLVAEVKKEDEGDPDGLFDDETVLSLVPILDKSKGWRKLAESLNYGYMISALEKSNIGPSRMLFNYMDLQPDLEVGKIRGILAEMNESQAVKIIEEMIRRRRQ